MTVAVVVKQAEGDKYPISILILSFMNSYMRSLSEDAPINQNRSGKPYKMAHTLIVFICV